MKLSIRQILSLVENDLIFRGLADEFKGFLDYSLIDRDNGDILLDEESMSDVMFFHQTTFGGSEGVYTDIYMSVLRKENPVLADLLLYKPNGRLHIATLKTLKEGDEAFLKMSRLGALINLCLEKNRFFRTREINGQECAILSEWEDGSGNKYVLGNIIEDIDYFLAEVDGKNGHEVLELDEIPSKDGVESDYLDIISARALDDYESEYGADGRRVFPHLNDDKEEATFKDECYEAYKLDWMLSHGYSLNDFYEVATELEEEIRKEYPDAPTIYIEGEVKKRFPENGFNGEVYSLKREFFYNEFTDASFMESLFKKMPDSEKKKAFYIERFGKDAVNLPNQ